MLTALAGTLLAVPILPVMTPPAHADPLEWAKRFDRDVRAAHQVTRGKGVTVAVVADGVDGDIGPLRGRVLRGRDFVKTPRPMKIHGTLMASLIGGSGPTHDSLVGRRGLAPAVKILPVRVQVSLEEPGARRWFGEFENRALFAKGIRYAADEGAQVIYVIPYIWDGPVGLLESALAYARSKGAVVVSANPDLKLPPTTAYPAALAGAIGVGAVNAKGKWYRNYSDKNSAVLVSAPGFEMPTTGPDDSLWTVTGAHPATAFVTATAALVRSEYPKLPPELVGRAIAESAHHPKAGYDTGVGFGIINPAGALDRAQKLEGRSPVLTPAAQGVVPDKAHFGGGPVTTEAVRHDTGILAGYSGLIGAGLLAIVAALVLMVRGRRNRTAVAAGVGVEAGAGPFASAPGDLAPPSAAVPPPTLPGTLADAPAATWADTPDTGADPDAGKPVPPPE